MSVSSDSVRGHSTVSRDLSWFTLCTDEHRMPKPKRFQSGSELRSIIKNYEDSVESRIAKHLENKGRAWAGLADEEYLRDLPNEVKGDLGVIRDLRGLESLGIDRGAVNQVNGEDYDIHAFKEDIEVQIETKNIDENASLSINWIRDKIEARFPSDEDEKARSGKLLRILTIPSFKPNDTDKKKAERLLARKGIHVVQTGKQVLSVSQALNNSEVAASGIAEAISGR